MGTWGHGIEQDDTVADILSFFKDRLKTGEQLNKATSETLRQFSELQKDHDEAPLLWLALAKAQWLYGSLDPSVLSQVRSDIESGRGLDRWKESEKSLEKRIQVLTKFLSEIKTPNPKPRTFPKLIVRKAIFQPGDCLSVSLANGQYTAALVLVADNSNPEYGKNLIASLDYMQPTPPSLEDFQSRRWLILSHGCWKNVPDICWYIPVRFRSERERFSLVGNIKLRQDDPIDSLTYAPWKDLGEQILLCINHRAQPHAS